LFFTSFRSNYVPTASLQPSNRPIAPNRQQFCHFVKKIQINPIFSARHFGFFRKLCNFAAYNTTMTKNEVKNSLSKHLFWDADIDGLDVDTHARYVIQRVLEYGELEDWKIIRQYYGLDKIVEECKQMRVLDPVCLSFICFLSKTNKEDYRCYRNTERAKRRTQDLTFR